MMFPCLTSSGIDLHQTGGDIPHPLVFSTLKHSFHHHLPSDILSLVPEATDPSVISEKISYALCKLVHFGLVQFWAPVKIGGRQLLTTIDQPFSFSRLKRGYCEYRKHSLIYKYNLNESTHHGVEKDNFIINGPPASAFLNHLPEVSFNLRREFLIGYPLLRLAVECRLQAYMVLPIFEPTTSSCVGVLECSAISPWCYFRVLEEIKGPLKGIGRSTYDVREHIPHKQSMDGLLHAKHEITKALKTVGKSAVLRLSQVWISYEDKNHKLATKLVDYYYHYNNDDDQEFGIIYRKLQHICNMVPLKTGQGLVGMTFQSQKPYYCEDVSILSSKQPLSPTTGLVASCFTICLRSSYTGSFDYVLEFLWDKTRHSMILLESIIGMLRLYLPSFKVSSGEDLGKELCVVRVGHSWENDLETFQICKAIKSSQQQGNKMDEQFTMMDTWVSQQTRSNDLSKGKDEINPVSLNLDVMMRKNKKTLKVAATNLDGSVSTMKRKGKEHGIHEQPTSKTVKEKVTSSCHGNGQLSTRANIGIVQDNLINNEDHGQMQDANASLTIKVKYGDDLIKFNLPSSTTLRAVEEQIAKNFENLGSFRIKYKDEEGDLISIIADLHLKDYIECVDLSNKTLFVHQVTT